jgi:hypothetical protein
MKTSAIFFFVGVAGAVTVACSSGSSASCGNFSSASTLNGNATLSSGPSSCPPTVALMGMNGATADAGASAGPCAPVVNGCTASVSCTLNTGGVNSMISATINASGMNFTGEETVTVNVGGTMVSCQYSLSGTFS